MIDPDDNEMTEAFRALGRTEAAARQRVWASTRARIDSRARRHGRVRLIAAGTLSLAAAAIVAVPMIVGAARTSFEPSRDEAGSVAIEAVMEMLGSDQASADPEAALEEFVVFLIAEEQGGAR